MAECAKLRSLKIAQDLLNVVTKQIEISEHGEKFIAGCTATSITLPHQSLTYVPTSITLRTYTNHSPHQSLYHVKHSATSITT